MRVLYGVCGEGMGHAMRSGVSAAHLVRAGCEVAVAASSRAAADYLRRVPELEGRVHEIVGPATAYKDNAVALVETVLANALRAAVAPLANMAPTLRVLAQPPDVVVSDFDMWSAYVASRLSRPLVALDNIHFGSRCSHPHGVLPFGDARAFELYKLVADRAVPGARRYMVLSMHRPASRRPLTTLHLPVLRPEVMSARWAVSDEGPAVAYHNSHADHSALLSAYVGCGVPVRVYGAPFTAKVGAVEVVPFDEHAFLDDLRRARFVVGGAGFTLLSECWHLGKPALALPFGGQFEQLLNASYVERAGWGLRYDIHVGNRTMTTHPSSIADRVRTMVRRADEMRQTIADAQPKHDGNRECLDALLAEVREAASQGR